jgi:hypothetical protein
MPVYFIRWAAHKGPIKIGWADDPEARLAQIQNMSPVPLIILNTLDCEPEQEFALHYHFAHLRLYGEWFKPKKELLRFVENPCRVIDRRPVKPVFERRPCAGFSFNLRDKVLLPCALPAIEGDDYCFRCNRKNPKGISKVYLDHVARLEAAIPRCQGITGPGDPCTNSGKFEGYCWQHVHQKVTVT